MLDFLLLVNKNIKKKILSISISLYTKKKKKLLNKYIRNTFVADRTHKFN